MAKKEKTRDERVKPATAESGAPLVAPPSAKSNVIANFAGRAWAALMALAFLPVYVRFLGIEAYSLIGLFVALMALLSVFDIGLSTTLNRELARRSAHGGYEEEARNLLRTFELVYWGVGIALGASVTVMASFIARDWLRADEMMAEAARQAILVMGLVIALQWPNSLYAGGLIGLQRQVLLNVIRACAATLQAGGAVLVLWLLSPTIQAYFLWQVVVAALHTAVVGAALWKSLPGSAPISFRKGLLAAHWRFAAGLTGIALLVALLTQLDKLVLSRMLDLEAFGYYALAAAVAGALTYISGPVFAALFPLLTQAAESRNEVRVAALYHKGSQLMAVLITPFWITFAVFSEPVLSLWFRDPATVSGTHLLVSLLLTGTALNALLTLPYALQLSYGWTALSLWKNLLSLALFLPLLLWLIDRYSAVGAALAWICLNVGYFLFEIPLMHRRLLKRSMARWYLLDVGLPLGICLAIGGIARLVAPPDLPPAGALLLVLLTLLVCVGSVVLAMPHPRGWIAQFLGQFRT